MLEHLTYNKSKHGERKGGEKERERRRERERVRERGPSQCAPSIFTLSA